MKRILTLALCLCMLGSLALAEEPAEAPAAEPVQEAAEAAESAPVRDAETEELLGKFTIKHGSRQRKMVAITVDDCYWNRRQHIMEDVEICRQHGVSFTFFPIKKTGCLTEECRDLWQSVLDAGCEIGCHGYQHMHLGSFDYWTLVKRLGMWQEALDRTLGYHYETRWMRAPGGSIDGGRKINEKQVTSALKRFGFEHIVHWDVSQTDPAKAIELVQPGSIMLFHANTKDTKCIATIVPQLLEQGYRIVTLSEMFGFDPPETSEELYVYDRKNYEDK